MVRQLQGMLVLFKQCFDTLEQVQLSYSDMPDDNEDYENPVQGHFTIMTCGHRGLPQRSEEKRVSRLLRKSGFIPLLEQLIEESK